jgi:hypothetical protein
VPRRRAVNAESDLNAGTWAVPQKARVPTGAMPNAWRAADRASQPKDRAMSFAELPAKRGGPGVYGSATREVMPILRRNFLPTQARRMGLFLRETG